VDIAIEKDRIASVGALSEGDAPTLDAHGLYVAPGFIDVHSHSDYTLLVDPRAVTAIHQGVTLEVIGNCGHGCFPVGEPQMARGSIYGYSDAVPISWTRAADYFDHLEAAKPSVNVLSLVPNGQLRRCVVGLRDAPASAAELQSMSKLLDSALADGAWGLSTGLEYAAECGAPQAEVEALCRRVARVHGLYATHTRRRDEGAADAVEEAVRTAEAAGCRLQVSHLIPRDSTETEGCMLAIERGRERGLDVSFDVHTRLFGFTFLAAAVPPWALNGGKERLLARLRDSRDRYKMKTHRSILSAGGDWSRIVLLDNASWPEYARRSFAAIGEERGQDPLDAVYDLLLRDDESRPLMVMISCHTESQQRDAFVHPFSMPGSDATTLAPTGPLADHVFHGAYTWAAWFYRFTVREQALLHAGEAIKRLTCAPAERLGIRDRGIIREGAYADLAIFDPATFGERGTTFEPNQLPTGMRHVLVNGGFALRDGVLTGDRRGRVIRRP
jgi:N-acyl-D-aspartate/D-glutamate deacylase